VYEQRIVPPVASKTAESTQETNDERQKQKR
jgi:hypothetical protein